MYICLELKFPKTCTKHSNSKAVFAIMLNFRSTVVMTKKPHTHTRKHEHMLRNNDTIAYFAILHSKYITAKHVRPLCVHVSVINKI